MSERVGIAQRIWSFAALGAVALVLATSYFPALAVTFQDGLDAVQDSVLGALGIDARIGGSPLRQLSADEAEQWRRFALDLINEDREKNGIAPVLFSSNPMAQQRADEMFRHDYLGYFWLDGRKNYMVQADRNGANYVRQNLYRVGFTAQQWKDEYCRAWSVSCKSSEPEEAIREAHTELFAGADTGHRFNILDPFHASVSIGIAHNGQKTILVQQFEGGEVSDAVAPQITRDGMLSLVLTKSHSYSVGSIATVYYDPSPSPLTPDEIDRIGTYCYGGGTATDCADPLIRILKPLSPDQTYVDIPPDQRVAAVWNDTNESFTLQVQLGELVQPVGIYTLVIWSDSADWDMSHEIAELSVEVF
jgi:hypothetical protein